MTNPDYSLNVFNEYKDKLIELNHYEACPNKDRPIPIDVCTCDCYVRRIFDLGRKAERDLFHGADR